MDMVNIMDLIEKNILKIEDIYHNWSIYGTGIGAEKVWKILEKLKLTKNIRCIFDNEERTKSGIVFHEYKVLDLENGIEKVDLILIGAELNHQSIYERLLGLKNVLIIDPFQYDITEKDKNDYINYIGTYRKSSEFIPLNTDDYISIDGDSKVIAWYLPQFHQMDINNKYHGHGFTEWTNTTRTMPQFTDHYQPHVPYDVGYYDLMNPETLKRQIFLAKRYGIYGFGFFYYWFSGKRIMEKPLALLLEHKELEIPFCLHWATDDWSMSWYGGSSKIILKQKLPDAEEYWNDISPFFFDERYIKISEKPLLVIYKCSLFNQNKFRLFLEQLRQLAKRNGFPDLYIMISTGDGTFEDVDLWGGDALVEYQPWKLYQSDIIKHVLPKGYINPNFKAFILDIRTALEQKEYLHPYKCRKYFRSALTSWDNSARKKETNAIVMWGNTPELMKQWLIDIMIESRNIHLKAENIVFISSWNEWAEGSHLEPDYRYGYAWLQAVREAIEESRENNGDNV